MHQNHKLMLALMLSIFGGSTQAAEQYFMRVPAPAKCAGVNCVMHPTLPAAAGAAAEPTKPDTPKASITSSGGHDFGTIPVDTAATMVLTITNTGAAPLTDAFVESVNAGFIIKQQALATTCGLASRKKTLEPGATCKATVVFAPTDHIAYAGAVSLRSSVTSDAVATYSVSGKGGLGAPVIDASALDFGTAVVGTSVVKAVTVTNTGDAPHYIGFGQQGDANGNPVVFSVASSCPTDGNYLLPVGSSCTYTVTATPTSVGAVTYNLYLNFGTAHPGYTVPMTIRGQ